MKKIKKIIKSILQFIRRIKLKNRNVSIISNNCWGAFVYQRFGIKYNSPFIGLFLFAPDYIRLLKNFEDTIQNELIFIDANSSKYIKNIKDMNMVNKYPIAKIDENIEIHFLHYKSEEEARVKWKKRVKRINYDNMLVKFCDRDECTEQHIKEFDNLQFKNKICFSSKKYKEYESVVTFDELIGRPYVENEWKIYTKYIDIVKILNSINI